MRKRDWALVAVLSLALGLALALAGGMAGGRDGGGSAHGAWARVPSDAEEGAWGHRDYEQRATVIRSVWDLHASPASATTRWDASAHDWVAALRPGLSGYDSPPFFAENDLVIAQYGAASGGYTYEDGPAFFDGDCAYATVLARPIHRARGYTDDYVVHRYAAAVPKHDGPVSDARVVVAGCLVGDPGGGAVRLGVVIEEPGDAAGRLLQVGRGLRNGTARTESGAGVNTYSLEEVVFEGTVGDDCAVDVPGLEPGETYHALVFPDDASAREGRCAGVKTLFVAPSASGLPAAAELRFWAEPWDGGRP